MKTNKIIKSQLKSLHNPNVLHINSKTSDTPACAHRQVGKNTD